MNCRFNQYWIASIIEQKTKIDRRKKLKSCSQSMTRDAVTWRGYTCVHTFKMSWRYTAYFHSSRSSPLVETSPPETMNCWYKFLECHKTMFSRGFALHSIKVSCEDKEHNINGHKFEHIPTDSWITQIGTRQANYIQK